MCITTPYSSKARASGQANANLVSKFPLSEVTQRTLKTMTFARVKFPLCNIQKRKSNYCMLKVAYVVAVMFKMARGEIRYKRRMRLKVILDCARLGTNEVLKQKGHVVIYDLTESGKVRPVLSRTQSEHFPKNPEKIVTCIYCFSVTDCVKNETLYTI